MKLSAHIGSAHSAKISHDSTGKSKLTISSAFKSQLKNREGEVNPF
jgi:hypothetical protein